MRTIVFKSTDFPGECGEQMRLPGVIEMEEAKEGQIVTIQNVGKFRVTKVAADLKSQQIWVRPID